MNPYFQIIFCTLRKAEESCRSFNIGTGPQQGQLVTVNNDDKNWSIRLMLGMGLKYQYDSNTMRAWTGMRKRQSTEGEVRKESEGYSPEDWEWADGTSPGEMYFCFCASLDESDLLESFSNFAVPLSDLPRNLEITAHILRKLQQLGERQAR